VFDSFRCRRSPQRLRRLAENTHKGATHPFLISKSGFAGDHFNGMAALRDHQSRSFNPQALDRLGGREMRDTTAEMTTVQIRKALAERETLSTLIRGRLEQAQA
jgi:hypothetical protein